MAKKGTSPKDVRPIKFDIRSRRAKAKVVTVEADGEPVGTAAKVTAGRKPVYISATGGTLKTAKLHRSEDAAVRRVAKRFPVITPRLRKKL